MGHLGSSGWKLNLRKIAALILLAVTMVLLLSPSIYISIKTDEGTVDFAYILQGYRKGYIKSEIRTWQSFLGSYGDYLDNIAEPADTILCNLKDSRLSPFELATTAASVSSLVDRIVKLDILDDSGFNGSDEYRSLMQIKWTAAVISLLLWLLCIGFFLSAFICAKHIMLDDRSGEGTLTVLNAVYTSVLIGVIVFLNAEIKSNIESVEDFMYDLLDLIGINMDEMIPKFSITAFPIVSFLCSIAIGIVPELLPKKINIKTPKIPELSGLPDLSGISIDMGWTCECGKKNRPSATFCADCGKKKVDFSRCENCGAPLDKGSSFCSKCGTPVNRKVFEPVCPSCGKSLKSGTKFCIYCGAQINTDAIPEVRSERRPSLPADPAPVPEDRSERSSDSFYAPAHVKEHKEDELQSPGRLKIKKSGDVEYK